MSDKKRLYIAGKMCGVPYYNFPAFDAAKKRLEALGFEVFSPADMDRANGFDPFSKEFLLQAKLRRVGINESEIDWNELPSGFDLDAAIKRDNEAIDAADGVYVITEGFSTSSGATAEVERAMKAGKVVVYDTMTDAAILKAMGAEKTALTNTSVNGMSAHGQYNADAIPAFAPRIRMSADQLRDMLRIERNDHSAGFLLPETIGETRGRFGILGDDMAADQRYTAREGVLDEAKKLICGDRNVSYGPPTQDFQRTADMMTALFSSKLKEGERFKASDVAWIITLVKASRAQHSAKRDNYVDAAGYMGCGWECEAEEQKKTEEKARSLFENLCKNDLTDSNLYNINPKGENK